MTIDLAAASAFLELLCDEFGPKVTFQSFDDQPDRKTPQLARIYHGSIASLGEALVKLNEQGAGIFVTVNHTGGACRKKGDVKTIRSVFIDIDGLKELPPFETPPSMIVRTPHGWHVYWLLEAENDMTTDECERVNKFLAAKYRGDKAVTDCARVLRVPGFFHRKAEPQLIEMVEANDRRYTRAELLALIPPPEPPKPIHRPSHSPAGRTTYGETALERECDAAATAPEGERNRRLNRAAFSLGQLVAGGELDAGDVRSALEQAGHAAGLPTSEVNQTINSGMRAGADDPRSAPRRGHLELAASGGPEPVPMPTDADAPGGGGKSGKPKAEPPPPREEWEKSLIWTVTDNGAKLTADPGNVTLIVANASKWKGCLAYDEFAHRARWLKAPPALEGLAPPEGQLADEHAVYCQQLFKKTYDIRVGRDAMHSALAAAAKNLSFHPVKDYLDGLEWDQHRRLDKWTHTYLGAIPSTETDSIGRWWMISAVARILDPGCQADHVIIFEGPQGGGKTRTVRTLAGEWYQGSLGDIRDKDGPQSLGGHWIVEIGELDALRGMTMTRIKDFLTQTVDIYRPAYGRYTVHRARQCVFAGTTNDARYLKDATGGRRFWPIACGIIDIDKLAEDRDQLWAEAVNLYRAGERWWPQGEEAAGLSELQEERYEGDPWEEAIARFVADRDSEISCDELLNHVGLDRERWDRGAQMRIGLIMGRLKWGKVRRRIKGGGTAWRFHPPEKLPF
jgi:predicted P-loop ATPase